MDWFVVIVPLACGVYLLLVDPARWKNKHLLFAPKSKRFYKLIGVLLVAGAIFRLALTLEIL